MSLQWKRKGKLIKFRLKLSNCFRAFHRRCGSCCCEQTSYIISIFRFVINTRLNTRYTIITNVFVGSERGKIQEEERWVYNNHVWQVLCPMIDDWSLGFPSQKKSWSLKAFLHYWWFVVPLCGDPIECSQICVNILNVYLEFNKGFGFPTSEPRFSCDFHSQWTLSPHEKERHDLISMILMDWKKYHLKSFIYISSSYTNKWRLWFNVFELIMCTCKIYNICIWYRNKKKNNRKIYNQRIYKYRNMFSIESKIHKWL